MGGRWWNSLGVWQLAKALVARHGDALARCMFVLSLAAGSFAYGVAAARYALFPVPLVDDAKNAAEDLLERFGMTLPWYFHPSTERDTVRIYARDALAPGLRLINRLAADQRALVQVVDVDGNVIHSWRIDWFEVWPEPTHLSADLLPKTNPGPVHGVVIAPNGDLIFNFERLGMARLDACGKVKWKLPHRTHHSIHLDEHGNIWTSGLITRREPRSNLPNYAPPFEDYTIVKVSPAGELLEEFSIADVLVENGLRGLLYLSTRTNRSTRVTGDTLHVNDIELFPQSMAPGAFSGGDIMVSLRNINTILVLDPTARRVKFVSVGAVIRQHDPDFVDGNTISVFDNNNLGAAAAGENPDPTGQHSRIVRLSATTRDIQVRFSGTDEHPFFTDIMGDHQLLPNGNMLLNESVAGRVIEVNARGDVIWEYVNLVGNGLAGLISDADVLPPEFDSAFFARAAAACSARPQN